MAVRAIGVALLLSSLLIAGCGTVANVVKPGPVGDGKIPFGGVKRDMSCLQSAANGECCLLTHPKSEAKQGAQVASMLLCAADLPFSLVGDVITWPYTAAYSWINEPVPVPPVIQAPAHGPPLPTLPVTQAPEEGRPQTPPPETLPDPRKQP
jgi:uncharacterized protein YceK